MRARSLSLLLLFLLLLPACDSGSSEEEPDLQTTLRFSLSNLVTLANGYHYEGWVIVDGNALSTGKFNVSESGILTDTNGNLFGNEFRVFEDIRTATAFKITIEPKGDNNEVPSGPVLLAGEMTGGQATLSIAHPDALGEDYSSAQGTYVLATYTDSEGPNQKSGLWFVDTSTGAPRAGLTLPVLPTGWTYEGWVVIGGVPVSTGTFTNPSAFDRASRYTNSLDEGIPFPGEDFLVDAPPELTFPTDLSGQTVVVSIEPIPDDSPEPFGFKPLVGAIPVDAGSDTPYAMTSDAATIPAGSVQVEQ